MEITFKGLLLLISKELFNVVIIIQSDYNLLKHSGKRIKAGFFLKQFQDNIFHNKIHNHYSIAFFATCKKAENDAICMLKPGWSLFLD